MDTVAAVKERRSIRSFTSEPVPGALILEILENALWSPSWGNTQPWEIYVLTGDILEKFKDANKKRLLDGIPPSPDIRMPQVWPETIRERYRGVGKSVLNSLSIARNDQEARIKYSMEMFGLFDAPCLIIVCLDRNLSIEYAMLDAGLIVETICLLATDHGLGTCIMAASVSYPDILRTLTPIPESKLITIGIVLGYPDWNSPVNHFERERASLHELIVTVK